MHAWTSPCNPDPLKPGVKLMAGCNSAGVGGTSVSLPVVKLGCLYHGRNKKSSSNRCGWLISHSGAYFHL